MPKGPQGQKRTADAIGLAVMVDKIATVEIEDEKAVNTATTRRDTASAGGVACARNLTVQQRID